MQAGWGAQPGGSFFPGSSGMGWGIGGAYGNKILPSTDPVSLGANGAADAEQARREGQQVDQLIGHLEDLTAGPQRPQQSPPLKIFKRVPSAMGARKA